MKASYRLLVTGFLACDLLAVACVSGTTVNGGGGATGGLGGRGGTNGGLGGTNGGLGGTNGGLGGTNGGLGGTNGGLGGATGGGLGGATGGGLGGATGTAFMPNCTPSGPLVSDMEDGFFYYGAGCPKGAWHLTTGGGGTSTPIAGDTNPVAITDRPPSTKAIHVSGSGQANVGTAPAITYGFVSLSASLNSPSAAQVGSLNAAGFTGVKFWGKITGPIEFHVPNVNTFPGGGVCSAAGGATGCFDDGKMILVPSATWTQYTVPFASLTGSTPPFGNPPGTPFPSGKIYSLEWHVTIPATGPVAAWDIWIDDVTFY